jgi:hypothetical protein
MIILMGFFHFSYKHIDTITGKSMFGTTSCKRIQYYNEFPPPKSLGDVLEIISDQGPTGKKREDTLYNIYTVATGEWKRLLGSAQVTV